MSPLQIAGTSVLLLACVYLSVGAHVPTRREPLTTNGTTCMDGIVDIVKNRTGTEAINAKTAVDAYFKVANDNTELDVSAHCKDLCTHGKTWKWKHMEKCTSMECMVNVSTNLQYLLSMYSHALGLIYQNSTSNAGSNSPDEAALDFLEMTFSRFSNQLQRYSQAGKKSCGITTYTATHSVYVNQQKIDDRPGTQPATGYKEILCQLRGVAQATMLTLKEEHCSLRPYKFCSSLADLNKLCGINQNAD